MNQEICHEIFRFPQDAIHYSSFFLVIPIAQNRHPDVPMSPGRADRSIDRIGCSQKQWQRLDPEAGWIPLEIPWKTIGKPWKMVVSWDFIGIYLLVMTVTVCCGLNLHIFTGKIHYFNGDFPKRCNKVLEGNMNPMNQKNKFTWPICFKLFLRLCDGDSPFWAWWERAVDVTIL